jgi:signal transduction histidine kinase/HAMP domain-containing protein
MRRIGIATILTAGNALLVLAALGALGFLAVVELHRLADREALARTVLAGAEARTAVDRAAEAARTAARLLAERPTLKHLVEAGNPAGLADFLERFRRTSGVDGCAVVGDGIHAVAGLAPPPPDPGSPTVAQDLLRPSGNVWLAATRAPVGGGVSVVAVRTLDPRSLAESGRRVGVDVTLLSRQEVESRAGGAVGALLLRALAGETPPPARRQEGRYLSLQPLSSDAGEVIGVLVASQPTAPVDAQQRLVALRLLAIGLVLAALVTAASLLLGRWLGRSARALTAAAERIGAGDLATPLPSAPGAELGTLADAMDDMRRRLLALTAELRRRQAESAAILSGIGEGVFTVDRDRHIRYLNPQVAALLGIDPDEVTGRFCGDVLRPRGVDGVRPCEESCPIVDARFRGAASAIEILSLPGGGSVRVVVASSAPVEDRQVVVLRDETGVEAARRLRDAVLANVSHEFKTPLAAQLASVELLRERLLERGDVETDALVQSLERGALRLTQLIDNLLESVRIEAGRDSIRPRPVALDQVIEEAVGLTLPLLEQRDQRVEIDLPYPLPAVEGDAARLTQVFVNLLANANKFAAAASTITVGGEVAEETVTLWVEDEGPGLPAAAGGSIFERFVRVPGSAEPEPGGIGLGLAIVRSIVERHGGVVEGRSVAGGARFSVRLPRAAAEVTA